MSEQNDWIEHKDALASERQALKLVTGDGGVALSISGGGIRSATFALGALQGLAATKMLEKFDYLSTVSGGGYIGGWLTAWKQRRGGMGPVIDKLAKEREPDGTEIQEISYLRAYSNYLTPKLGIGSFDTWALIATVVRNMLLNWTVAIPVLMGLLMLPRIYATSVAFSEYYFQSAIFEWCSIPCYDSPVLNRLADHWLVEIVLPVLSVIFFAIAVANLLRYLPSIGGVMNGPGKFFRFILLPLVLALWTLDVWDNQHFLGRHDGKQEASYFAIGGGAAFLIAVVYVLVWNFQLRHKLRRLAAAAIVMVGVPTFVSLLAHTTILWDNDQQTEMAWFWAQYTTYSLPLMLIGVALGMALFVGAAGRGLSDADREWLARATGAVLLLAFAWAIFSCAVLLAPIWLFLLAEALGQDLHGPIARSVIAISVILGWMASRLGRRERVSSADEGSGTLTAIVAVAFIVFLAVGLALLTNVLLAVIHRELVFDVTWHPPLMDLAWSRLGSLPDIYLWTNHEEIVGTSNPIIIVALAIALVAISWLASRLININTFSLQGMYRFRLVRAYLGATNQQRTAHPFTGFDPSDDLMLKDLDAGLKPYHVVNMTLNQVGGDRLDWQQRKASSFIASALHCGSRDLGYRSSKVYGGRMTLGMAMATSGAAASPNMGSRSSPLTAFIMTLFNARLGVWMGNPKNAKTCAHAGPRGSLSAMLSEMSGATNADGAYVYLSDGGHFENLGLYEMVARGCRDIMVFDGGADPDLSLADLGNALRKIEVDMGIGIRFLPGHIDNLLAKEARCALATIGYSDLQHKPNDGRLIYVKPLLRGNESPSILSYVSEHPTFPHESTGDQWFDESQTECYRQLGLTTVSEIAEGFQGDTLEELFFHLRDNLASVPPATTTS